MVESVQFVNFKALRDVELTLDPFTVLVGPNASGKTSILQGVHYLGSLTSFDTSPLVGGIYDPVEIRTTDGEGPLMLLARGTRAFGPFGITLRIVPPAEREFQGWGFELEYKAGTESGVVKDALPSFTDNADAIRTRWSDFHRRLRETHQPPFRDAAFSSDYLRLDPAKLSAPSYSDDEQPSLSQDGTGMASVLAELKLTDDEGFRRLEDSLRRVIPGLQRIRIERAEVGGRDSRRLWGHRVLVDMTGSPCTPAAHVSEGTLLVLGLLTALLSRRRADVILLDDLDRALHPKAMGDLVGVLRQLLTANPGTQIIATTHSPYLIDHLTPQEVRLTTVREDGTTVCGSLTEHPDFDKWKDVMLPGEFWSTMGEQWLLDKREHADASK